MVTPRAAMGAPAACGEASLSLADGGPGPLGQSSSSDRRAWPASAASEHSEPLSSSDIESSDISEKRPESSAAVGKRDDATVAADVTVAPSADSRIHRLLIFTWRVPMLF
jgi:hypothetical protein